MRSLLFGLAALAVTAAASPAEAITIYVANNCSGQPTPCTTNLQSALDDSRYATVELLGSSTFTGDFLIDRSMTLTGTSSATIQRASGTTYALHIENTTAVDVMYITIVGRAAVKDSSDVLFKTVSISAASVALQINNSDQVQVRTCTVDAADRAIDYVDSQTATIVGGTISSDSGYAVVASSTTLSTSASASLTGALDTVVLQDGNDHTIVPSLTATSTTFVKGTGYDHVWTWNQASRSYTTCTPSSPTEEVSTSSSLVSLISYGGWGGQ